MVKGIAFERSSRRKDITYEIKFPQFRDEMRNLSSTFSHRRYVNRGRTNEQFVYDLYKAFLLEPDRMGMPYWVSVAPTNGRDNIRLCFGLPVEIYTTVFWR